MKSVRKADKKRGSDWWVVELLTFSHLVSGEKLKIDGDAENNVGRKDDGVTCGVQVLTR